MALLDAGKYIGKPAGQIVIYETEAGAVCAAIPCEVAEGDKVGIVIKHTMTLVSRYNKVLQKRTCDDIKSIFGWSGHDPFWLMDQDLSECRFAMIIELEVGQNIDGTPKVGDDGNPVYFSRVKWLNPIGAGLKMPVAADRQSVLARYGSLFRAWAGGAPVKAPAKSPTTPLVPLPPQSTLPGIPVPPTKPAPPQKVATSTAERCWEVMCKGHEGAGDKDIEKEWFLAIQKMFPGKTNADLSKEEWGSFEELLTDNIPF